MAGSLSLSYSVPSRPEVDAGRRGHRLAWCRAFDALSGVGTLVDLEDQTEVHVERAALRTEDDLPWDQRVLYAGAAKMDDDTPPRKMSVSVRAR